MAERQHLPAVWELSLWTACPLHGCRMVCECQACGKALSWSRKRLDRCCDGTPFDLFGVVPAPKATVQLLRRLASVLGFQAPAVTDTIIASLTDGLSAMEICELVWLLGRLEAGRSATAEKLSLPNAAEVVEAAALILSGWPDAFHIVLERVYAARAVSAVSMKCSLGPLFRRIYSHRSSSNRQSAKLLFVYEEFRRFNGQRNGWAHSRSYLPAGAGATGRAALGELSSRLGVNWRSVCRLVRSGMVPSVQHSFGRKKNVVIVDTVQFTEAVGRAGLTAECRRRATETEACGSRPVQVLLGVSEAVVEQFHDAGLLGEPVPLAFNMFISGKAVGRLLTRLEDLAAAAPRLLGYLSATAGKRRKITRMSFVDHTPAECLRAVLEGRIAPVGVIDGETGLKRFSFDRAEVRRFLDTSSNRP